MNLRFLSLYITVYTVIRARMKWAGHVACMGDSRMPAWFWGGKTEEKRQLIRRRHWWKDNIKRDRQGMGWL